MKLIIPPRNSAVTVDRIATVDGMIADLNWILKDQIEKQRIKAAGSIFSIPEIKIVEGLTDALVKLSREERERMKNDDIGDTLKGLSDEEILKILKNKSAK